MFAVEFYLLVLSVLFIVSILTDKIGSKLGVPALLLFLLVGMIFGEDGIGLHFHNIEIAQVVGTCALCVILFSGGMDTDIKTVRPVLWQGVTLSTLGVVLMAGNMVASRQDADYGAGHAGDLSSHRIHHVLY